MRREILFFLLLGVVLLAPGCLQRWVYVEVTSQPRGAHVQVQDLPGGPPLTRPVTPTGHYLRCGIDAVHPEVRMHATHWRYRLTMPDHNDETLYVERAAVAKACADSKAEARKSPYRLRAKLLALTTERGLENTVTVRSTPSGATVRDVRTGKVIGKTPLRHTFVFYAPYTMRHSIRIEAPGYVPLERAVDARTLAVRVRMHRPGEEAPNQPPPKMRGPHPPPRDHQTP